MEAVVKHLTFAPLSSRILQRVAGWKRLEEFACETRVVCEAESEPMRPPIVPAGELERITGVHEFSAGLDDEIMLAMQPSVWHTETIAYRLRNVGLLDGQLCNFRSYKRLNFERANCFIRELERIDDTVALCSTDAGNGYFAHFLLDDIPMAMLGRHFGRVAFGGARKPRTQHMHDYLAYCHEPLEELTEGWFKDLWVFEDHAQNRHRRERMQILRSTLSQRFGSRNGAPPAFIRRGRSGTLRFLENELELEEQLAAYGFTIVDPQIQTAEQICSALSDSPLVIGMEGSQLAHGVLNLRPGGTLLCIQPATRFNAAYRGFCNSLDLDWGFVVAERTANGFRLPWERLLAAIEMTSEFTDKKC